MVPKKKSWYSVTYNSDELVIRIKRAPSSPSIIPYTLNLPLIEKILKILKILNKLINSLLQCAHSASSNNNVFALRIGSISLTITKNSCRYHSFGNFRPGSEECVPLFEAVLNNCILFDYLRSERALHRVPTRHRRPGERLIFTLNFKLYYYT